MLCLKKMNEKDVSFGQELFQKELEQICLKKIVINFLTGISSLT